MNDTEYARMIEIPVSSCDVTCKKNKYKLWKKKADSQKRKLIEAINSVEDSPAIPEASAEEGYVDELNSAIGENSEYDTAQTVQITTKKKDRSTRRRLKTENGKKRFDLDLVGAQIAVVIVLAMTILLTNIFWADSGINNLMRGVFASDSPKAEDVSYTQFSAVSPSRSAEVSLEDGVMTFSGSGSIYSVCDGTVTKVAQNAQKWDITIEYSPSFSAVISGADYAYYTEGESVYKSVPVCYSTGGEVKVYLYDDGQLLKNYTLDNGKIVWQS